MSLKALDDAEIEARHTDQARFIFPNSVSFPVRLGCDPLESGTVMDRRTQQSMIP